MFTFFFVFFLFWLFFSSPFSFIGFVFFFHLFFIILSLFFERFLFYWITPSLLVTSYRASHSILSTEKSCFKHFGKPKLLLKSIFFPTNTPRVFHIEMTWKHSFPRRFNVEYTWWVCRVASIRKIQFRKKLYLLRSSIHIAMMYSNISFKFWFKTEQKTRAT